VFVGVLMAAGLLTATGQASAATAEPPTTGAYLWFAHSAKCVSVPENTTADRYLHQWTCWRPTPTG
jgi:hypothetical protein